MQRLVGDGVGPYSETADGMDAVGLEPFRDAAYDVLDTQGGKGIATIDQDGTCRAHVTGRANQFHVGEGVDDPRLEVVRGTAAGEGHFREDAVARPRAEVRRRVVVEHELVRGTVYVSGVDTMHVGVDR